MKTLSFFILGCFICTLSVLATDWKVYVAKYKQDKMCAVSYTFDDGLAEHYSIVAPELEKRGFRGTFWVCGYYATQGASAKVPRITWSQLKEMADSGHEISNHSWSHKKMSLLPLNRIKEEIDKNDSTIFANIGIRPVTYCYPFNYKPDSIFKIASENRVGTRTKQTSIGSKSSVQRFAKWLDGLIKNREWGIGMTHGINYGYDAFQSPSFFWEHLDKVKSMEDKVWVATFREVAAYIKEQEEIKLEIDDKKNGLTITPRLSLNKKLFTEPLTMVVERNELQNVSVTQGRKRLPIRIVRNKVIFDFNPYGGSIKVRFHAK